MKKIAILFACLFSAAFVLAQAKVFVPKVGVDETPVLDCGEVAVGVLEDGEPVQIRVGDGVTPGGKQLYDARSVIRTSPIDAIKKADYSLSLSGAAFWTNGLVAGFPPTSIYDPTLAGTVTVTLATTDYKIQSIVPSALFYMASVNPAIIAPDGHSATIEIQHMEPPPGFTVTHYCYFEDFTVLVYSDPDSMGETQDMRGFKILLDHPSNVIGSSYTNTDAYLPVTKGYYEAVVQDSVAYWYTHPANARVTAHDGMKMDDGRSIHAFMWDVQPNGYMSLNHVSDITTNVFRIEAMDPYPWIANPATATVSTLDFTTNGLTGTWYVQTKTNFANAWANAAVLSTNASEPGYMSITASNTLGGIASFWRVLCSNAVQAQARATFTIPVKAPRFDLGPDQWLYWSNGLRIHSGSSNGLVNVTWE